MRVLFLAGREIDYSRNAVMLRALEQCATVRVIAENTTAPRKWLRTLPIVLRAFVALRQDQYDLLFVGFYGYIILRLLGPFVRIPILFDAFVSNYDTLCFDRQLFAPHSLFGRLAFWLDNSNVRRATHILLDTEEHAKYFLSTFQLDAAKVSAVPVGCRDDIFFPAAKIAGAQDDVAQTNSRTRVLYYCTFLPLHGVRVVLDAAKALEDEPIDFCIIGDGPLRRPMAEHARQIGLTNVTWKQPVAVEALAGEIAEADICLGGHFGNSDKAQRVVPGKIYQMLAMARAVIASRTLANSQFLRHDEHALLIPPQGASALAHAIMRLHRDMALRQRIAAGGRSLYLAQASESAITEQICGLAEELVSRRGG